MGSLHCQGLKMEEWHHFQSVRNAWHAVDPMILLNCFNRKMLHHHNSVTDAPIWDPTAEYKLLPWGSSWSHYWSTHIEYEKDLQLIIKFINGTLVGGNVSCLWIRKVQYTSWEGGITLLLWWLTFCSCPPSHSWTPGSLPCTVTGWNTNQHQLIWVKVTTGDINLSVCGCVGQQCIPPLHSGHIYGVRWDYSIWGVTSPYNS